MRQSQEPLSRQTPDARLVLFFPTHVIAESWPLFEEHGPALRETILARRASEAGASLSNMPGWRSDNDMMIWGGGGARALCDHVSRRADAATHDKQQQGSERRFRWAADMSADVAQPHAPMQIHSRPGAYLSAIYCLDDGYGGSDDPTLGGELVFLDPRFPMVRMRTPDLRVRRPDGSVDQHEVRMRPVTGQMVIFPSWLAHGVRPFRGETPRISIGINLSVRPAR